MGLKFDGELRLTIVDWLFVLFSITLIFGLNPSVASDKCHALIFVEPFLMAYCIFRILFVLNSKRTSYMILFLITVFCLYELFVGYTQLFQNIGRNRGQDVITGSFSGSGPLGCLLSVFCGLSIAVCVKTTRRFIRISLTVLSVISFVLMSCTLSRAAMISFGVCMLFLAMKSEKTASFIRKYKALLLLIAILLGAGAYLVKKPSADGRILMARVGLRIMKENGLSGVGLGNYAGAYGKTQAEFFADYIESDDTDTGNIPEKLRITADSPAFCFNEFLRVGIECGPVSMLLLICMVVAGIAGTYKRDSVWCYPLISISVFACFSYPFEVGVFVLLMTVCLAANDVKPDAKGTAILFFSLLCAALGSICYVRISKSGMTISTTGVSFVERFCCNRHKTYLVHDCSPLQDGLYDERMLFALGQSLNRNGEYEKSDEVLSLGTRVSSDPMFWNVMGNNSKALGKFREAESRYKSAFRMVPNRLYPLYLLAKLYYEEGDTVRFLEMEERMERFVPKVESVNTEKMRSEIRQLKCGTNK